VVKNPQRKLLTMNGMRARLFDIWESGGVVGGSANKNGPDPVIGGRIFLGFVVINFIFLF
jgi:hypothetical protein